MRRWAIVALVAVAAGAGAHSLTGAELVASIAAPAARVATGVERVAISPGNDRVLVVEVGAGWYALAPEARAASAADWRAAWRRAVPGGIVAVLDAGTGTPVVRFAPGGDVVAVGAAR